MRKAGLRHLAYRLEGGTDIVWTLDQWKQARRVDHLQINILGAKFNPRFRDPQGRPDLKVFDAQVAAFWAADNNFDKVSALASIVADTSDYIGGFVALPNPGGQDNRYLTPVQGLQAQAQGELNLICGGGTAVQRDQDIVNLNNAVVPAPKVALVNVYYIGVHGSPAPNLAAIDAFIDNHINVANGLACYTTARLTIARHNPNATLITDFNGESILYTDQQNAGLFHEGARSIFLLIGLLNGLAPAPAGRIDLVYHEGFVADDVQGFTARTAGLYSGRTPNARPIVLVRRTPGPGGALTHPTTLAHEMGHALCECGQHASNANDLMSGGATRNGVNNLSIGQMAWFRNNPYAV